MTFSFGLAWGDWNKKNERFVMKRRKAAIVKHLKINSGVKPKPPVKGGAERSAARTKKN